MKKIWLLVVPLILLITLAGCTNQSSAESQRIVAQTISVLGKVNSYKLDTDVINIYKVTSAPEPNVNTTEWKGTKLIDLSNRKMKTTMDIITGYGSVNMSLEMYILDGRKYIKEETTPGRSNIDNPWNNFKIADGDWSAGVQIPYYIEILKSATKSDLLGSENVNGVDCYVLKVIPSVQSVVGWVVAQDQSVGPQIDVMMEGVPVVRADAYRSSSVKLWIDKDTNLPLKAQIEAVFDGYVDPANHVNSSFSGQVMFSNYNQPVTFQVPQEALNAHER